MSGQIILGLALGLPLLLGLLFRVSTPHIFFSLMAGELLARYFGNDLEQPLMQRTNFDGYGEMILLTLPMILTAVFLKGSISKGKAILHIAPLVMTGVIFAAFLLPILPQQLQQEIQSLSIGEWLLNLNKVIIGGMVVLQLVTLWLLHRRERGPKNKNSKKNV